VEVLLAKLEVDFLRKHLPARSVFHDVLASNSANAEKSASTIERRSLYFDSRGLVEVRDQLGDLFVTIGLGQDQLPNATGVFIETLIDRFSANG
jgi:hypothetical protein